ncbi:xanthine dehydrogenase family protein molybdopterin-binding subunit [Paracraurococcus lichenis]|uniref:Xanthine dehydrogenase family protein molybdopterin-binding subunit n=1 Tax=Paracraurococcus lichenis TaxID=3064888 RepID=A0ABT9E889_9PROT|nr:xanthine dehydrogenase family protein molybdopterin-binding subunit [Paracraurococcus sp. LOR1-02]MDO9712280.1 xanthine dehydrogenase family protein molybdopterin-binding subunit [Paracraurococcus sp. LOR1-02]
MNAIIGQPVSRVDGPAKVTGQATYAAEFDLPGLAHAAVVPSTIPCGRITRIDTAAAERAPGVLAVLTHENAPRLAYRQMEKRAQVDAQSGEQLHVLQDPEVRFNGQPLALVVAETPEQATHAAGLVQVDYERAEAPTEFDPARGKPPAEENAKAGRPGDAGRGDADAALARAPVRVEATYEHPREHHNAIEPHVTIAQWEGEHLTLFDKTQWVDNDRKEIAHVFDMPEERIRVVSPFVGGAFGSALRTWPHVTLAALGAKVAGRPVRLELTRRQLYSSIGFRPHTRQRVALGATQDGRLQAVVHEAWSQVAQYEEYAETTLAPTQHLYACANLRTRYRLVEMATNSPCPMRAPGVATGVFAMEMAMDELAAELGLDPLELRLRNYVERDEQKDLPWSSKKLRECYEVAARRFGWDRRRPEPRSLRDGHLLVGTGMATAIYHSDRSAGSASVALTGNGTAVVRSAASDMGPGTYTSMTQVAAETLGLPVARVRFELGDTNLPFAPVHGGSITMASVGNAIAAACGAVQSKLIDLVRAAAEGPFAGLPAEAIAARDGGLARREGGPVVPYAELLRQHNLGWIEAETSAKPGEETKKYSSAAFGAVFVEVRVDEALGTVRVPRIIGAYDVGRVINPKIARSQCIGGQVGGLGMALEERAEWDPRFGKVMNANLAEYHVPVNADIIEQEAIFVPNDDRNFNPLGVKGLAEVAICGIAPAIANAVWHATGKRICKLPITPESLLA